MSQPAVEAVDLCKSYRLYRSSWDRLRQVLAGRPRRGDFHALEGVSFALPEGEGLGIIGENGAGKSTLLKILAGITAPTSGRATVRGKVASILELGSGFHPELTGRQNIVLNAAMLGLGEREVRERTPAIVEFGELGEFIDQPVKCYSTGMAVRLGFAIATQVDPDVLIIDEALSVGDGYFQKKCMDRLLALEAAGRTLLFCSHAMYYVSAFCRQALWLRRGKVEALGPTSEVVREYEDYLNAKSAERAEAAPAARDAARPGPARIRAVRLPGGDERPGYAPEQPWEMEVEWESDDPGRAFHVGVGVNRLDEVEVLSFSTHADGLAPLSGGRAYAARLRLPKLPLVKGAFTLYVFLLDEQGLHVYDQRILRHAFTVESPVYRFGLVSADHRWDLDVRRARAVEAGVAGA
jgi:ABC-type polysaccharide/polyol phosphate transport system ATPase subunit